MKTFFLIAFAFTFTSTLAQNHLNSWNNPARVGGFVGPTAKQDPRAPAAAVDHVTSQMARDPYRKITLDGEERFCDLRPLFAWTVHRKGSSPMPKWEPLTLRVTSSNGKGLVGRKYGNDETIQVKNFPYKLADESLVLLYAIRTESTGTYRDKYGMTRTVWAYAITEFPTPPPPIQTPRRLLKRV
jgi:hypothetical protein